MLKVNDLNVYYGHIHAVKGISFDVKEGEILTLIGANGAGKTTTIKNITGVKKSQTGQIVFQGSEIGNIPAREIVKKGIGYVPEGRRVFPAMTVHENLEIGAFSQRNSKNLKGELDHIYDVFPALVPLRNQLAGRLSGGEQQMLAIGRALMSKPKLLVMDEPSLGLAPKIVNELFKLISELNHQGITVLLVEQNALGALRISHRGVVMETGKVVLTDSAKNLMNNPMVKQAYLGL